MFPLSGGHRGSGTEEGGRATPEEVVTKPACERSHLNTEQVVTCEKHPRTEQSPSVILFFHDDAGAGVRSKV